MLPAYLAKHSQGRLVQEYDGLSLTIVHLNLTGQVFISDGYDLGTGNLMLPRGLALAPQELEKTYIGMDIDCFSKLSMRNGNVSKMCGRHKGVEARR